jgi:hypothetical protein
VARLARCGTRRTVRNPWPKADVRRTKEYSMRSILLAAPGPSAADRRRARAGTGRGQGVGPALLRCDRTRRFPFRVSRMGSSGIGQRQEPRQLPPGFAATRAQRVVTGTPLNGDAGMSQRWLDVPVDVYATLKNGHPPAFPRPLYVAPDRSGRERPAQRRAMAYRQGAISGGSLTLEPFVTPV